MPTILRHSGFRFFFYSKEGNEPPHIHVIGHGGEMKIWLDNLSIAKVYALSPKHQNRVIQITEENIESFKKAWVDYHGSSS